MFLIGGLCPFLWCFFVLSAPLKQLIISSAYRNKLLI
jgi:hypothetical protein